MPGPAATHRTMGQERRPQRAELTVPPRQLVKVLYPLAEILLLVLCATIAAADDFVEIKHWGETHMDFLRRFLPYKDGIPSHDALNDLMNALDHALFSECFITRVNGLREGDLDVVSVDGKTSRRTHAKSNGRQALHMVSAWASRQRLVLGQQANLCRPARCATALQLSARSERNRPSYHNRFGTAPGRWPGRVADWAGPPSRQAPAAPMPVRHPAATATRESRQPRSRGFSIEA